MEKILCKNCGIELSVRDNTCPKCGSSEKAITLNLRDSIELHSSVGGKVRDWQRKLKYHFEIGENFFRKTKQWNYLERIIDWTNNFYKELIKNKDGKIIKDIEEPLSQHQGHGFAKYIKK
ncbi:zinc ribbon domain-containing protein [Candidatus Falkowbacteria bacterium CG11_big_fil_rev_8_21_14_0_20_39_10]|uniref:Zinc ribbon domain-containing protein n=1 Tax=Candidatus Falkowbacteria bacterium CG11_big_fil_rev_8_21_14_0_20_39_10 TaxID=1974570 RepID=A0A2M6K873_9BACT|nr:MAG: zinc ribbon domain-containing protein [Candidatus Falkowbacteria bacterium CG11_big_fil_rev_8_21_14_0_20_39_10]